jgi:hypothetical protein
VDNSREGERGGQGKGEDVGEERLDAGRTHCLPRYDWVPATLVQGIASNFAPAEGARSS